MCPSRVVLVLAVYLCSAGGAAQPQPSSVSSSFEDLIRGIRTGNAYQRAELIPSFAQVGDPKVVPELMVLLRDEDTRVRVCAAQHLARLADARSADALALALTDGAGQVRRHAAEGLSKVGRARHVPALVTSVVNHLPGAKTQPYDLSPSSAALAAIAGLSAKAPPELVALMAGASEGGTVKGEAWWRLLADVAGCLGRIGDQTARGALLEAQKTLETDHQDYRAWYAVRIGLAALDPKGMAFHRPAAEILNSERLFKGNTEDIRRTWVTPLAQLGLEAVDDLAWALQFDSEWDRDRVNTAVQALGEIGGSRAAEVLRRYLGPWSRLPERERRERHFLLGEARLALLKADPTEATVQEIMLAGQPWDLSEQEYLIQIVSRGSSEKIPRDIKVALCRSILRDGPGTRTSVGYLAGAAARLLGEMGGPQAGEILSMTLLSSPAAEFKEAAARALGTIQDYDAMPALVQASVLVSGPTAGAIAWAMGTRADPRAVPALKDMAGRKGLSEPDRLWIAAALARLDVDYADNARRIRQALPDALEQAQWLHDEESIRAIADLIPAGGQMTERAARALEAIGTDAALNALTSRIDVKTIDDAAHLQYLCHAAARIAAKLGRPAAAYWTDVGAITSAVRGWFVIGQQARPAPDHLSSVETVVRNVAWARKVWIAEANRRLDLAATGKAEPYEYDIPGEALVGAKAIYGPELASTLGRIAGESTATVDFHGPSSIVKYYHIRSLAAGILTEKVGQVHTFVDVDGRTHAGSWNPSQPDSLP